MINQLRAGALLSYVNIIANVIVGLFYTPVMLRLLGQAEYGLYSLIGALVGYLSVLDLGLGNTIVRYTARNRAVGNARKEAELNGLFLFLYSIISCIAVIIGIVLYLNLDNMFGNTLSPLEMKKAQIMTILLIVNLAFTFPLSVFGSIIQAYERFVFLRVMNIFRTLLNPCITLPFLIMGYGSVMMVVITTVLNISCLLANVWYCFKYLSIKICRGHFEKSFLKEVAGYSFFIFLNVVMDKIYWGTGQFVLGMTRGTLDVAVYAIAVQFLTMYMQFSTAISGVLLPKVTMLVAEGANEGSLTELFIKIGRLQFIIVGFILTSFILLGREFIKLWAGSGYLTAYPMIVLLMASMFIPLLQNAGIAILQAMNLNRYRMTVYSIIAFINLACSFPLAKLWGGFGCAIGTSTALFLSTGIIMNRYYEKRIGLNIPEFWKNILMMAKGPIAVLLCSMVINSFVRSSNTWGIFATKAIMYSCIYGVILYFTSLNEYEKGLVHSVYHKFLR
ncbi:MAG: oligosaccharide flippase family protein [Acidaminococcus sp.]|nr:oligosaccharide flippase family protein [Acidaminococcus sp.]MCI2116461.1 oligosaccharide flippase family protein [Acidaminococcus sp.]